MQSLLTLFFNFRLRFISFLEKIFGFEYYKIQDAFLVSSLIFIFFKLFFRLFNLEMFIWINLLFYFSVFLFVLYYEIMFIIKEGIVKIIHLNLTPEEIDDINSKWEYYNNIKKHPLSTWAFRDYKAQGLYLWYSYWNEIFLFLIRIRLAFYCEPLLFICFQNGLIFLLLSNKAGIIASIISIILIISKFIISLSDKNFKEIMTVFKFDKENIFQANFTQEFCYNLTIDKTLYPDRKNSIIIWEWVQRTFDRRMSNLRYSLIDFKELNRIAVEQYQALDLREYYVTDIGPDNNNVIIELKRMKELEKFVKAGCFYTMFSKKALLNELKEIDIKNVITYTPNTLLINWQFQIILGGLIIGLILIYVDLNTAYFHIKESFVIPISTSKIYLGTSSSLVLNNVIKNVDAKELYIRYLPKHPNIIHVKENGDIGIIGLSSHYQAKYENKNFQAIGINPKTNTRIYGNGLEILLKNIKVNELMQTGINLEDSQINLLEGNLPEYLIECYKNITYISTQKGITSKTLIEEHSKNSILINIEQVNEFATKCPSYSILCQNQAEIDATYLELNISNLNIFGSILCEKPQLTQKQMLEMISTVITINKQEGMRKDLFYWQQSQIQQIIEGVLLKQQFYQEIKCLPSHDSLFTIHQTEENINKSNKFITETQIQYQKYKEESQKKIKIFDLDNFHEVISQKTNLFLSNNPYYISKIKQHSIVSLQKKTHIGVPSLSNKEINNVKEQSIIEYIKKDT